MSFETYLTEYFQTFNDNQIKDAMLYAIAGGKHFRPNLLFAVVEGFKIDKAYAYPAALALEMIHSYSLIHDDLPCMDNDDFRRGKPSVHKAFGENIAVLTGDSLLTHAFGVIADSDYPSDLKVKMLSKLSSLAGLNGMIYGQLLDISNQDDSKADESTLNHIQDYKTGALFKAALYMGMEIADDSKNTDFYTQLALNIGRLFQIQDDLFEVTKDQESTGKSLSDSKNHKLTSLSLYSIDDIQHKLDVLFDDTYALLDNRHFDTSYLSKIIKRIQER